MKDRPFLIVAWYRPPSDPPDSFKKLQGNLKCFEQVNKEIIVLGDTNCDMSLSESSPGKQH